MKKPLLIIIIVLAVLLIFPIVNFLGWSFQSKKPLNVILVDKTVPSFNREKHKSLNWVINNDRFVNKDTKKSYSVKDDYYGFVPTRPEKARLWDKNEYRLTDLINLAENSDVLYFADTYGVFFNDWYHGSSKSRRSRKLYGGLNNNDNLLIKEMKDRSKLVIIESNTFEYPTVAFESQKIQERLGIEYSGWTGKYFSTLDTTSVDFPIWMTAMYRKQYKQPWSFTNEGVVFLSDKNIIVLEQGKQLNSALPVISSEQEYMDKWGLPESVPFDQWFEVISPINNSVISSLNIDVTDEGLALLNENGLSNVFPAVIVDPTNNRTYYFAGDFTYYDVTNFTSIFKGADKLKFLNYSNDPKDTRRFFWLYYKPLIEGVFNDYYSSL